MNDAISDKLADDTELLEQYLSNRSEAAFSKLVEKYWSVVYSACMRRLSDSSQAEEATQAVFVALVHKASKLVGRKSILPWLLRVSKYVVIDMRRRHKRQKRQEFDMSSLPDKSPDSGHWDDMKVFLDDLINRLPETQREALVQHYLCGHSYQQIADSAGCGISTIQMRVKAGLDKLRSSYKRKGFVITSAAIGLYLESNATAHVPSDFAFGITQKVLATSASNVHAQIASYALKSMIVAKIKTLAIVAGISFFAIIPAVTIITGNGISGSAGAQLPPLITEPQPKSAPQVFISSLKTENRNIKIDVRYSGIPANKILRCDLHWLDNKGVYKGKIKMRYSDGPKITGRGRHLFSITFPKIRNLGSVIAVTYACGYAWNDQIAYARSKPIAFPFNK